MKKKVTHPVIRNVAPEFKNETKNNKHIITLSGTIANLGVFENAIDAQSIRDALDNVNKDIVVKLNSGGGDVFEGIEIYNYLKSLSNHITVEVTSLAASAASLVAMAGDEIVMRNGSNLMVHEASTMAFGNKSDIQKTLNALSAIDTSIVDIYQERTGLDKDEIIDMLASETWLTADEAIQKGFADSKTQRKAEKQKEGVKNMGNDKYVAFLKKQQQLISNALEEEGGDDEPSNDDSIEERVGDLENKVKNLEKRVKELEKDGNTEESDDDNDNEETSSQPQNKFSRFAF